MKTMTLVVMLTLMPLGTAARDFTHIGIGGGGWLQSGTFHPTDPDFILMGTDITGGIYRTLDGGTSWTAWNEGLTNDDLGRTNYVDDLLGITEPDGGVAFYAATQGGIYRSTEAGPWTAETPAESFYYSAAFDQTWLNNKTPIAYSCLDYDEDSGRLVAGAGQMRYSSTYETGYYPGLPDGDFNPAESSYPYQHSVWARSLTEAGSAWAPYVPASGDPGEFGSPRGVSTATVSRNTWIAVTTPEGIWISDGSDWQSLHGLPLDINSGQPVDLCYGESFTAWSVHLTERGVLYVALRKLTPPDGSTCGLSTAPGGVYMLNSLKMPTSWLWVGDFQPTYPATVSTASLFDLGLSTQNNFIYLSVAEGASSADDVIYLGDRYVVHGLSVGHQVFSRGKPVPFSCDWETLVYSDDGAYYWRPPHGEPTLFSPDLLGWSDIWGVDVNFEPVLFAGDPASVVAVQFSTRLHKTMDGGQSWENTYCTGSDGNWTTTGYSELCTRDLDFMADGRLLEATADCGLFLTTSSAHTSLDWYKAPYSYFATGTDDYAYTFSTDDCGVRHDWRGEAGQDMIFAIVGRPMSLGPPSKLFMITPETKTWSNLTACLDYPDRYNLHDFAFLDDDNILISYTKMDRKAGSVGQLTESCGVLRLQYSGGAWTWSDWSDGLDYQFGTELLYNERTNTVLLTTRNMTLTTAAGAVQRYGGIFYRENEAGSIWQQVVFDEPIGTWNDFRCLAQSRAGAHLYAGSSGNMGGTGGVLHCPDPAVINHWEVLANGTGNTFGLAEPFFLPGSSYDPSTYYKTMTFVDCIAVDLWDPTKIAVGVLMDGFGNQKGLWQYDAGVWTHLSDGRIFAGMGVDAIGINYIGGERQLVIGTTGQECYFTAEAATDPGDDDPYQPPVPEGDGLSMRILQNGGGLPGATTVAFGISKPATARLQVFDVRGRLVWETLTGALTPGQHVLTWPGAGTDGSAAASGVYLARLQVGEATRTGKMLLVR